jgi:hypothetical protein
MEGCLKKSPPKNVDGMKGYKMLYDVISINPSKNT